ncbi:MAG: hypothetical protein M1816_003699 [Peltula sp. TS41687]|nr:MAG: hypothetical protein M1816_003699 [Peltula sp. TS41687]
MLEYLARSIRPSVYFRICRQTSFGGRQAGLRTPLQNHISTGSLLYTARRYSGNVPQDPAPPEKEASVSQVLHGTDAQKNSLLAPVHVSENPDGVLKESHPAARLLANSSIVVQRQLELMNVMIGFEQANKYVIMDPQGNLIGYMAEREQGLRNTMTRQLFRAHRSFTTHVFDRNEVEILRFHRPFSWISSRISVYDPLSSDSTSHSTTKGLQETNSKSLSIATDQSSAKVPPLDVSDMRVVGEAQQQWAPLRRKYDLFVFRGSPNSTSDTDMHHDTHSGEFSQFAHVDEPFLSWDFSLKSQDSRLIGSVNRNFAGFAREIFTDTGVYALRMDAAGLADEPRHLISQTGRQASGTDDRPGVGMTLDQRAVMLATAVSIDFDYFSRHSHSGGMSFMPIWFPGMGGTAAEGGAAAEAGVGAEAGAGAVVEQAGQRAVGGAAGGAAGIGASEAMAGAGTLAGYEAMKSGLPADGGSPAASQAPETPPDAPPGGLYEQGEEVWGQNEPWAGGQGNSRGPPVDGGGASGGGAGGAGGGGGEAGGGGGWFDGVDVSDWF